MGKFLLRAKAAAKGADESDVESEGPGFELRDIEAGIEHALLGREYVQIRGQALGVAQPRQLVGGFKVGQQVIITRGRDGMAAFNDRRKPVDIPIFGSDEVADVTGAGDTVIATFTAALAAGATSEEAAQLANYAGGIVVMKRGTATVTRQELLHAIEQTPPATRSH